MVVDQNYYRVNRGYRVTRIPDDAVQRAACMCSLFQHGPARCTARRRQGFGGLTAVVSDDVPSQTMILADAQQVAAASDTVQLSAATQAVVQLDTGPDSPVSGSTVLTSLWQSNLTGLKAERVFGCQKLTSSGVCVLTGANYTGDRPGP
jgi:hypothetical protein